MQADLPAGPSKPQESKTPLAWIEKKVLPSTGHPHQAEQGTGAANAGLGSNPHSATWPDFMTSQCNSLTV